MFPNDENILQPEPEMAQPEALQPEVSRPEMAQMEVNQPEVPAQSETPVREQPQAYAPPVQQSPAQQQKPQFVPPVRQEPAFTQPESYAQPLYPQQPGFVQPEKPKKKSSFWRKALAAVLVIALVAGGCLATAVVVNDSWQQRSWQMEQDFEDRLEDLQSQIDALEGYTGNGNSVSGSPLAETGSLTPGQVYAQNVDAVVMVSCQVVYGQFGQTGTSTGSGFIISRDGYVVTNHHVVEGAVSAKIITHQGEEIPVRIIGSDSINDIALLKAEAENLPCVALGSSRALIVGDQGVAIGNPLGELTSTMTVGYVSGKERSITTDGVTIDMIQTDAAINSGNSGGPLFNMKGQVVGITTAKYSGKSSTGASIEGIGFAIPMDDVLPLLRKLQETGYIKTPFMGVTVAEMNADMKILAQAYNMPVGLTVQELEPDGPALAAGIQVGDVILALDGKSITSINELSRALRDYKVGDAVTVSVFRAGTRLELTLVLAERPRDLDSTPQMVEPSMPGSGDYND